MKSKKAQLNLNLVVGVFITFLVLAVIGVAVILALTSLGKSNIFTIGSAEYNQTKYITSNVSAGVTDFFSNTGTILGILVVVIIISAIALVILVVRRFGGGAGAGNL